MKEKKGKQNVSYSSKYILSPYTPIETIHLRTTWNNPIIKTFLNVFSGIEFSSLNENGCHEVVI